MKIAIISDLHLGDDRCKLVANGNVAAAYQNMREAVRRFSSTALDYLVLAGDVLDFSINSFSESCRLARPFFRVLKEDALANRIVYIPGNHDKHIWDAVEWETNVIRKLKKHEDPRPFRRSQPGFIDYGKGKIELPGVSRVKGKKGRRYGTLFLEGLFDKKGAIEIDIVYPNLYINTPSGQYMVTHGHMLETAWVLLSELFSEVPGIPREPTLEQLEEFNVPLTSAICTGVGQAGEVSKLFYAIQAEAKAGKSEHLRLALDSAIPRIDLMIKLGLLEFVDNMVLGAIKKQAIRIAEKQVKDPRADQPFLPEETDRQRFLRFYHASCVQARESGLDNPDRIIFGHTHRAWPAADPRLLTRKELPQLEISPLTLYNTGGWLNEPGRSAEVFFIGGGGELSSVSIQ